MRKLTTTQRIEDFLLANIGRGFKPAQVRDALSIGSAYTTFTALKRLMKKRHISRTRGLYHIGHLTPPDTVQRFAQDLIKMVINPSRELMDRAAALGLEV